MKDPVYAVHMYVYKCHSYLVGIAGTNKEIVPLELIRDDTIRVGKSMQVSILSSAHRKCNCEQINALF